MIELLFVACLIGEPETCEEKSLVFAEGLSRMACMSAAQPQLARWAIDHPGWRIAEWSCRTPREREIRA